MNLVSSRWLPRLTVLRVCVLAFTCAMAAKPIGMSHAYLMDLAGIHALMGYGLCSGPCRVAQDILLERYDIHTVRVAGCVVWGPGVWYSDGYNDVTMREVIREQGSDVFEAAHDEAIRRYRRSRGQENN